MIDSEHKGRPHARSAAPIPNYIFYYYYSNRFPPPKKNALHANVVVQMAPSCPFDRLYESNVNIEPKENEAGTVSDTAHTRTQGSWSSLTVVKSDTCT